jgi:hypothetical protein
MAFLSVSTTQKCDVPDSAAGLMPLGFHLATCRSGNSRSSGNTRQHTQIKAKSTNELDTTASHFQLVQSTVHNKATACSRGQSPSRLPGVHCFCLYLNFQPQVQSHLDLNYCCKTALENPLLDASCCVQGLAMSFDTMLTPSPQQLSAFQLLSVIPAPTCPRTPCQAGRHHLLCCF